MSVGAEGKILVTTSANVTATIWCALSLYQSDSASENNLFVPVYLPCNRARSAGAPLWKELAVSRKSVNSSGLPCFGGWYWYPKALAHTEHGQEHLRTLLVHTSIHVHVCVLCLTTEDEREEIKSYSHGRFKKKKVWMEPEMLIRLAACNLKSAYCIGRTCSETPKYTVPCLQLSFYLFSYILGTVKNKKWMVSTSRYKWYSKELSSHQEFLFLADTGHKRFLDLLLIHSNWQKLTNTLLLFGKHCLNMVLYHADVFFYICLRTNKTTICKSPNGTRDQSWLKNKLISITSMALCFLLICMHFF